MEYNNAVFYWNELHVGTMLCFVTPTSHSNISSAIIDYLSTQPMNAISHNLSSANFMTMPCSSRGE